LSESAIAILLPTILNCIVCDKSDRCSLRLSLLKGIFNCYADTSHKVDLYMMVLQYATQTNQVYLISSELDNIEKVIQEWELPNDKKIELYLLAINILISSQSINATKFIQSFLSSIESDFNKYTSNIKENVLFLIKNDNIFCYGSLVDLPAVHFLETEYNPLFTLLKLLISGEYSDLEKFCTNNNQFLLDEGVDREKLLNKFRIIRLAELASAKDILKYEEIAQSLFIDIDDVETWVIRTISKKIN